MTYSLSQRSLRNLEGVHPDLVAVVERAIKITPVDFVVTEGRRSRQRQEELVRQGASQTLNSRHLTGHAVDVAALADGKVSWKWSYYEQIASAVKQAAEELGVPITWGGDWKSLKDGPHFELDRSKYP